MGIILKKVPEDGGKGGKSTPQADIRAGKGKLGFLGGHVALVPRRIRWSRKKKGKRGSSLIRQMQDVSKKRPLGGEKKKKKSILEKGNQKPRSVLLILDLVQR